MQCSCTSPFKENQWSDKDNRIAGCGPYWGGNINSKFACADQQIPVVLDGGNPFWGGGRVGCPKAV